MSDETIEKANKDKQKEAASLEKVTDYVEEETIGDTEKTKQALSVLISEETEEKDEELAAVSINKDDIDFVIQELDVPRDFPEPSFSLCQSF